jgi:hypothetical protein
MSKRARSSIPQFRVRVPAKVVAQLRGKRVLLSLSNESDRPFIKTVTIGNDVSFSLETDDRLIAESRQANALDHFRRLFELTAADPVTLSHKALVALSGETYRIYSEIHSDNPGEPGPWAFHKALHRAALEGRIQARHPLRSCRMKRRPQCRRLVMAISPRRWMPFRPASSIAWRTGLG